MRKAVLFLFVALFTLLCKAQDQSDSIAQETIPFFNLKTNLLYDATSTFNLGAEFRLNDRWSLELPFNYNPFTFSNDRKWKHFLVQPELRWWTKETFKGHFFGAHAHYGIYNVAALPSGPFSQNMHDNRYEGSLMGAGVSYGYRWDFSHNWGMEATLGVGYAYLDQKKYPCIKCGQELGSRNRHYVGPTKVGLSLIYTFGGKKKQAAPAYVAPVIEPIAEPEPLLPYVPQLVASFVMPEAEAVKVRREAGKAYLDYPVGKAVIDNSFKNNAVELQRIYALIEELRNDPDATIAEVEITGFASPDGGAKLNQQLSEKRAYALQEHLRAKYDFEGGMFTSRGAGEDWRTFEQLVEASGDQGKEQILTIIRNTATEDQKERQLAALGSATYNRMKADVFPRLRRSDYALHYTVLPFTVEEGKEIFKTKPSSLSLNEMFLIANTYEPGSAEFNEVFETAARLFPDSDEANLNATANALNRKDLISARNYLAKVKQPTAAYYNNRGMLFALEGEWEKASADFERAGQIGGDTNVNHNKEEMIKRN